MADWFRKSTWTAGDRADFEQRLLRAHPSSRAQYLRIQASHLADSGHHRAALDLLHRLLEEYDDPLQLAQAFFQCAQCCDAIDDVNGAAEAYRAALIAQRNFPQVRTRAGFEFPLLVALRNLRSAFAEALSVLEQARSEALFPQDHFQIACAHGLIAAELGDAATAKAQAVAALAAAAESHSGLDRHPTLGLARTDPALLERLRRVASEC